MDLTSSVHAAWGGERCARIWPRHVAASAFRRASSSLRCSASRAVSSSRPETRRHRSLFVHRLRSSSRAPFLWVDVTRGADVVRAGVRAIDAGSLDPARIALERRHVAVSRLDTEGGVRYLLRIGLPAPLTMAPDSSLSGAQREVAQLAAAGATVSEIARALQRSVGTVRTHLAEVYRRLGVSNRIELTRALDDFPVIS